MSYGVIAKTNGRNKVLDFRDGLILAKPDDYAMIHGKGGKGHAPTSVIKIAICDYSSGTGDKSTTLFANISPDICQQIYEVCKRNVGSTVIDDRLPLLQEQRAVNRKLSKTADMGFNILVNILGVLNKLELAKETPAVSTVIAGLRARLEKTRERVIAPSEEPARAPAILLPRHADFNYTQDRVHVQKTDSQGFAPLQRLVIFHTTYRNDGQLGRYPWTIKITNSKAKVRVQPTGATTYDASTMRDTREAFIQVSDADMFRMMDRVTSFIRVWEIAMGVPLVQAGEAAREEERKKFHAGQKEEDDAGEVIAEDPACPQG